MLEELFVDNYKALVNFSIKFGRVNVLLGANGSGKTTVLEALNILRRFMRGGQMIDMTESLTRWHTRSVQTFKLTAKIGDDRFRYTLEVEHDRSRKTCEIKLEQLMVGEGRMLFEQAKGSARLYVGGGKAWLEVLPGVLGRSILPALKGRDDSPELTRFADWLASFQIIQPDPFRMSDRSEREDESLRSDGSNFADWWRSVQLGNLKAASELKDLVGEVMHGFEGLQFKSWGPEVKILEAVFKGATYTFAELSEGQRVLILLYALMASGVSASNLLALDEGDNFVSLREVQPWCNALLDRRDIQAIIVSHHPEVLNLLATEHGLVFRRKADGPVEVERFTAADGELLTPAELIARGHLDADS